MPYPVNRGAGPLVTYTWRDTAVLAKGGPDNHGVPLDIEVVAGVEAQAGTLAGSGQLPSIGLPLLMEYRCFPSDTGLGFNLLGIQIGSSIGDPLPAFRAYSSGGINTLGSPVLVNPDTELFPRGGFNPAGTPPGSPTQFSAESVFYLGQLDTVTRLSRVHTVWLDTSFAQPSYLEPFVAPFPHQQPAGTGVVLDYRGATGFSANASPFDATQLDAYGDVRTGTVTFHGGLSTWTDDIGALDGARYLQVRLTFRNDVETGASAELSTLGLVFAED